MADTGNGATYTNATLGSYDLVSISIGAASVEPVDTTLLSETDWMTKIPGDVGEPGTITLTCLFNSQDTADFYTLVGGASTSTTITFPLQSTSNTTAGTISGTAILTEWKPPDLANNEVQTTTFTLQWDGQTEPTFAEET